MTEPHRTDIQALSDVLKEHTAAINASAINTEALVAQVQREGDLREVKVERLEAQALTLKDQTAELQESNDRLAKFAKLLLAGLILNIVALLLMAFLLVQFNKSSVQRSKIAADQRQQQQELLIQQNRQTIATARCAIVAKGNVSVYDTCVVSAAKK